MKQALLLAIYYGILQRLPSSRHWHGLPGYLRRQCSKGLFLPCGPHANIERRAFIGFGRDIRLGAYSGIGIRTGMGVVDAGSIVTMPMEPYFILAANPVRVISSRAEFSPPSASA